LDGEGGDDLFDRGAGANVIVDPLGSVSLVAGVLW